VSSVKAAEQRSISLSTFQQEWDRASLKHLENLEAYSFIAAPSMDDGIFHFAAAVWKEISSDSNPQKAFWVGRIITLFPNSSRRVLQPGFIYHERAFGIYWHASGWSAAEKDSIFPTLPSMNMLIMTPQMWMIRTCTIPVGTSSQRRCGAVGS
jgi:hypothetical protein